MDEHKPEDSANNVMHLENIVNEYINKMVDALQSTKTEANAEVLMLSVIAAGIATELNVLIEMLRRM